MPPSSGVMPRVSPTVPMAEAVSNIQVSSGSDSTRLMIMALTANRLM